MTTKHETAISELTLNELETVAGGYVSEWGETYGITDPKQFTLYTYCYTFLQGRLGYSREEMKSLLKKGFIGAAYAEEYPDIDRYINDLVEYLYDKFGRR